MRQADIAVVGAGAAGLFAAIWAARTNPAASVVAIDGAKKIGAKILISGGGRCNVTHHQVDEKAFAGSTPAAIRKILRRFDVEQTVRFFRALGVELKQESTGKLFPVTDRAQTVLTALLLTARSAGVQILTSHRVVAIERIKEWFVVSGAWGEFRAQKVILSTGGQSVPQTGSDGQGYGIANSLGHSFTERIFPGLVPLTIPRTHFLCELAGISAMVELQVQSGTGAVRKSFENSMLCTHFGISGPAVLDISRYYLESTFKDPATSLVVNWLPRKTTDEIRLEIQQLNRNTVFSWLRKQLPERLARSLCAQAGISELTPGHQLTREYRSKMVSVLTAMTLPVTGDRGFRYAEVTAGGVPLRELNLNTMESRKTPGLFLCGEICDVDGQIGGFNFQWAWASGYVAGTSAGKSCE